MENKQKFISQIMSSKSPVRSCEDVDETALSYAEIKALCAGNPLIAEKMNLDIEVTKLRLLKSEYQSQHYRLEDRILTEYPKAMASTKSTIAGLEKDIAVYAAHKKNLTESQPALSGSSSAAAPFAGMTVDGVEYTEKEPAAKALLDVCTNTDNKEERAIGKYMGFQIAVKYDPMYQQFKLSLRGSLTYTGDLGADAFGNITRINNALEALPKRLETVKEELAGIERQQEAAKLELEKPFLQEAELNEKEARLSLLNADLNIDSSEEGFDVENDDRGRDGEFEVAESDDKDESDAPIPARDGQRFHVVARDDAAKPTKPSILNGIHGFTGNKSAGTSGKDYTAERAI